MQREGKRKRIKRKFTVIFHIRYKSTVNNIINCSADTQKEIDEKVVELVNREHEKAKKILTDNRKKLDELAMFLYEKETITGEEFMKILNNKEESEEK